MFSLNPRGWYNNILMVYYKFHGVFGYKFKMHCVSDILATTIEKIVNEYDQEIPQSQTADNPVARQGRAAQPSRDTRKTNQAKQPAPPSPPRWLQYQMDIKQRTTKHRTITDPHNGSNNKQKVNNNRTTALERTLIKCQYVAFHLRLCLLPRCPCISFQFAMC